MEQKHGQSWGFYITIYFVLFKPDKQKETINNKPDILSQQFGQCVKVKNVIVVKLSHYHQTQ